MVHQPKPNTCTVSTVINVLRKISVAGLLILFLAACGGGESPPGNNPPTPAQRISAATTTAQNTGNACKDIQPFYWEIGNASAALASGSVNDAEEEGYTADSLMSVASASKWLYAAYVAQRKNSALSADDIKFLNFHSGYTNFSICLPGQTVNECLNFSDNGLYSSENDGKFYYDGGHMQKHASLLGLGGLNNATLAAEIQSQLGADIALGYTQPQLAGGVEMTPANYARFLRKLLTGALKMGILLGSHAVCTNPNTCPPGEALVTPIPLTESWRYSIGHWVEDDPLVGDGAFSSTGAFGFYPWVDKSRSYYGIVARKDSPGQGYDSAKCGRLIRKAWMTGTSY